jgi:hypothetical protein
VTADGVVVAFDALQVINALNSIGSIELAAPTQEVFPPPYIDVNGDNFLSAIDALLVINELNAAAAGEGEPAAPSPAAIGVPRLNLALAAAAVDDVLARAGDQTGSARERTGSPKRQ